MYICICSPPDDPSSGSGSEGDSHGATETVTNRKSLAVLLYYTICHVVSSIVNSCILRH